MAFSKSSDPVDVSLDLEDFTPRQLRKLLSKMAKKNLRHEMSESDKEESDEEAQKENDDLVNLHEDHTGDSKAPKVKKDDLPIAENDLEDAPEKGDSKEMIAKASKKDRK